MITDLGPINPRQISREFRGVLPAVGSVALVAKIIRDGLEATRYPEYKRLIALSDEWLVEQTMLVTAIPNDVWIRNGFDPLGDWEPSRED